MILHLPLCRTQHTPKKEQQQMAEHLGSDCPDPVASLAAAGAPGKATLPLLHQEERLTDRAQGFSGPIPTLT